MRPTEQIGENPASLRAAIYTRVSTDDQAREGYSLGEQERRNRELIEREGWECVGVYPDAGVSGARASRPELDRLLRDVLDGKLDVAIVFDLSRLARDAGITRDLLRVFDAAGVRVVASGQALDRKTAEGRLQTGILAEFAEFEKAKIVERTKIGIQAHIAAGKPWGSSASYGYRRGEDGHWQRDPAEVRIVERVFREYVEQGRSYNNIARRLSADRVPTRLGSNWTSNVVRKIIAGQAVLGFYYAGGEWHRGRHEPIIDETTWLAAQSLAERRLKYAPRGAGRTPRRHLFTHGMLRCGLCGSAMLPQSNPASDVYRCSRHAKLGAEACPMPPLRREDVDGRAFEDFAEWRIDFEASYEHALARVGDRLGEVKRQAGDAERALLTVRARREKVERDYLEGDLSAHSYERLIVSLDEQTSAAEAERDQLAAHLAELQQMPASLDDEAFVRRFRELAYAVGNHVRVAVEAAAIDHQVEAEGLPPGRREALAMAEASHARAVADIGPLRAAIARVFTSVTVNLPPAGHSDTPKLSAKRSDTLDDRIRWEVRDGARRSAIELEPKLRPDLLAQTEVDPDGDGPRMPLTLDADNQNTSVATR